MSVLQEGVRGGENSTYTLSIILDRVPCGKNSHGSLPHTSVTADNLPLPQHADFLQVIAQGHAEQLLSIVCHRLEGQIAVVAHECGDRL